MQEAWHLITSEYPPQRGGVSDYARQLAGGLAGRGAPVHVWAPAAPGVALADPGVEVHRLRDAFRPGGLRELSEGLAGFAGSRRLLVQYVPHGYGYRAMNVPFCAWLNRRPRSDRVWLMFHEAVTPWGVEMPLARNLQGAVTRAMAWLLATRANRILVSTTAWVPYLRALPARLGDITCLPIPSNLPLHVAPEDVQALRRQLTGDEPGARVLGHFGTYGQLVADLLVPTFHALLERDARRRVLLLGRGGARFSERLAAETGRASQVLAPGELPAREVAVRLSACDLLIQPFAEGITTRRTSAMAGLALGLPLVTNAGFLSEPEWPTSGAVALADRAEPEAIAAEAEALLASPERRATLGATARKVYAERFSMERTLETLLAMAARESGAVRSEARP